MDDSKDAAGPPSPGKEATGRRLGSQRDSGEWVNRKTTEEELNKQIDSLQKLCNQTVEDFESKLHGRDNQLASLDRELLDLRERVLDDDSDDISLDDKGGGQSKNDPSGEKDMLLLRIEALEEEIESLRVRKDKDSHALLQLRSKLARSENLREELGEDRSNFRSGKDKEMDPLRVQPSETREAHTARELERPSQLKCTNYAESSLARPTNDRISAY